jgi:hypothetical protein
MEVFPDLKYEKFASGKVVKLAVIFSITICYLPQDFKEV